MTIKQMGKQTGKQMGLFTALSLFASMTLASPCHTKPTPHSDCETSTTQAKPKYGWSLHVDQDMFIPARNQDRDYTMGMAFELFKRESESNSAADYLSSIHHALEGYGHKLNPLMPHDEKPASSAKSYMLGLTAYTPDDLSAANPILNDRPYSSILYFSNKHVLSYSNHAIGSELRIGLLGLNITNQVQTWMHRRFRASFGGTAPVDPKGWGNQISDGGELTALFRLNSSKTIFPRETCDCRNWDLSLDGGVSLGYQTNVNIGVSGRLGKIDSKPWTLPYDPVNRGNFIPSTSNNELYVWSAYRARLIAYDALLQGQFRNSEYTVNSSNIKRLVHESGVGITGAWKAVAITFSLNLKTGEIKGEADRTHVWGGLSMNYRYD